MTIKTAQFLVTVRHPKGVSLDELEKYIATAIRQWAGGGDPQDPLWELTSSTPRVRSTFQGTPSKD